MKTLTRILLSSALCLSMTSTLTLAQENSEAEAPASTADVTLPEAQAAPPAMAEDGNEAPTTDTDGMAQSPAPDSANEAGGYVAPAPVQDVNDAVVAPILNTTPRQRKGIPAGATTGDMEQLPWPVECPEICPS